MSKIAQISAENLDAINEGLFATWSGVGRPVYLFTDEQFAEFLAWLLKRYRSRHAPDKLIGDGVVLVAPSGSFCIPDQESLILEALKAGAVAIGFISFHDRQGSPGFSVCPMPKPDSPLCESAVRLLDAIGEQFVGGDGAGYVH